VVDADWDGVLEGVDGGKALELDVDLLDGVGAG